MAERAFPNVVVRRAVRNQSSRGGVAPRLIVIHATVSHNRPGKADLSAIADWFQNPASQASSHVCTDGDGNSARFVADAMKAWHCAGFNSVSLGVEQIGMGEAGEHWAEREYEETARWVAYWSRKYRIPIQHGKVASRSGVGVVLRPGIVRHSDLGLIGGGHHDPGSGYSLQKLERLAKHYARLQGR